MYNQAERSAKLSPQAQAILAALNVLIPSGAVAETRVLNAGPRDNTNAGYYDDRVLQARDAALQSGKADGVFTTAQQLNPALLSRRINKIDEARKMPTTSDNDIERYRWLICDFDPVRPTGIPSTDSEHDLANQHADALHDFLVGFGFPHGVRVDSGNGAYLLIRIDLPNDKAGTNKAVVERCLKAINQLVGDDQVHVDLTMFNPARIIRIPGTLNRKGESTPERPHRQARLINAPEHILVASLEQLQQLADLYDAPEPERYNSGTGPYTGANQPIDIDAFIRDTGLAVKRELNRSYASKAYLLEKCEFCGNTDHCATLMQMPNGAMSYKCSHNSCAGKGWKELRASLNWRPTRTAKSEPTGTGPKEQTTTQAQAAPDQATVTDTDFAKEHPDLEDAAIKFKADHGDKWAYNRDDVLWLRWNGTHWQAQQERSLLDQQVADVLRSKHMQVSSAGRLDGVVRLAAAKFAREFKTSEGLVNFANGTLDTRSGAPVLRPHNRADGLTYTLPYAYAPGEHPIITAYLQHLTDDPIARRALMVHIGLSLIGDTRLHYMVLLIGPTRCGKSTALKLANLICGQPAAGFAGPELFDRQSEGLRSREQWSRNRVVCLDELPTEALRNEELAKAMSAHSGVAMRGLHKKEKLSNQWGPKLLMCTNDAPRYSDRSGALTGRLIPIQCPHTIPEGQRDKYLEDSFVPELPAFAAACIDQALAVLSDRYAGYPISAEMRALLNEIETEGDPIKSFVAELCKLDPNAFVASSTIYDQYRRYCQDNGNAPVAQKKFTSTLLGRFKIIVGKKRIESKDTRGLFGIRMLENNELNDDPTPDPEPSTANKTDSATHETHATGNITQSYAKDSSILYREIHSSVACVSCVAEEPPLPRPPTELCSCGAKWRWNDGIRAYQCANPRHDNQWPPMHQLGSVA